MGKKTPLVLLFCVTAFSCYQFVLAGAEQKGISPKIGPLLKEAILEVTIGAVDERSADDNPVGASLVRAIVVMNRDDLQPLPDTILSELRQRVEGLGGHVGGHAFNNVEVRMPLSATEELAEWSEIRMIRNPFKPKLNYATSEGVAVIGAPTFHGHGLRGNGVKIGVVDSGFQGYSSLLGTELPASTTINVFGSESDFTKTYHGTGCAEIVHDVAPEAAMFLANSTSPSVGFANAVSWLESQDVNVISCSLAVQFPYGAVYETLHPSGASIPDRDRLLGGLRVVRELKQQWHSTVDNAVSKGTAWCQAAGNSGNKVW